MVYAKRFILPSESQEWEVIDGEKRTFVNTAYPFKNFPDKNLRTLEFDKITLLYGGNGSGKSTLINVMAHKVKADRYTDFNDAPLFDDFVAICRMEFTRKPLRSCVLTSDDVFDYAIKARGVNDGLWEKREELIDKYGETRSEAVWNTDILKFKGLDDYERWSEVREILSPRKTQSTYVKKRVARDIDLHSNGETAMRYFVDRIDEDALYFLDEPENSLSIELQTELADYISATARATDSQFIIATHSPILLSMKGARIYNLDSYPVTTCKWTELPNVRKYFDFFMDHKDEF